uniref:DUF5824 domain-containing protein n=1 Tax=viral metagenome TaxID=1070528 RepID=A0A6C0DQU7_9ZZZZ
MTGHIPEKYIPQSITKKDYIKQRKNILKSRKLYKKGIFFTRPPIKSFKVRKTKHLSKVRKMYGVENLLPSLELARKTKCTRSSLKKIVNKGEGAYYSSGSRPSQTAESWGLARLGSAITGDKASIIDYHILKEGCQPESKALRLATRRCKREKRCKKYTIRTNNK